ncbi:hypothetical protein Pelo_8061 [Pelomyxa schiedti]|nr:hypothetical protein Pelo_8061 [Pelomyxa schiedti]
MPDGICEILHNALPPILTVADFVQVQKHQQFSLLDNYVPNIQNHIAQASLFLSLVALTETKNLHPPQPSIKLEDPIEVLGLDHMVVSFLWHNAYVRTVGELVQMPQQLPGIFHALRESNIPIEENVKVAVGATKQS